MGPGDTLSYHTGIGQGEMESTLLRMFPPRETLEVKLALGMSCASAREPSCPAGECLGRKLPPQQVRSEPSSSCFSEPRMLMSDSPGTHQNLFYFL